MPGMSKVKGSSQIEEGSRAIGSGKRNVKLSIISVKMRSDRRKKDKISKRSSIETK